MAQNYREAVDWLTYDLDIKETRPEGYDWRKLQETVRELDRGPLDLDAEPATDVDILEPEQGINAGPR